jgi:hypothetical protein
MAVRSLAQQSLVEPSSTNSMLAGYESNYFHHLETVRLSSGAASVEFTNLSRYNDFQHLQLRVVGRIGGAPEVTGSAFRIRFNGQTTTYYGHFLRGNGSGVVSNGFSGSSSLDRIPWTPTSSTEFGVFVADILDFNDPNKNTTVRSLGGMIAGSERWVSLNSFLWSNTEPVTSITIDPQNYTIGSGSRLSLYGLKARS